MQNHVILYHVITAPTGIILKCHEHDIDIESRAKFVFPYFFHIFDAQYFLQQYLYFGTCAWQFSFPIMDYKDTEWGQQVARIITNAK